MTYENEIKLRTISSLWLWKIRVYIKRFLSLTNLRKVSYCKRCGIDVRDFSVTDEEWNDTFGINDESGTLCYNCFYDLHYLHKKCCNRKYDFILRRKFRR